MRQATVCLPFALVLLALGPSGAADLASYRGMEVICGSPKVWITSSSYETTTLHLAYSILCFQVAQRSSQRLQ